MELERLEMYIANLENKPLTLFVPVVGGVSLAVIGTISVVLNVDCEPMFLVSRLDADKILNGPAVSFHIRDVARVVPPENGISNCAQIYLKTPMDRELDKERGIV